MNLNLVQATMVISQVHIYTEFFFTINDYLTRIRRINFCFTCRSQVFNCWSLIDCSWLRNWSATCFIIVDNRCCTICLNFNIQDTVICFSIFSIDGILDSSLFLFCQAVFIYNSCQFRICHWKTILELTLSNTNITRKTCLMSITYLVSCNRISLPSISRLPLQIVLHMSLDCDRSRTFWRSCDISCQVPYSSCSILRIFKVVIT